MELIIAEKPSVAGNIAGVLGAKNKRDGYFEGNGYYVTYVFGHLFTLYDAKDYDPAYGTWDVAKLPVVPEVFKYKLIDNSGVKKQFKVIRELVKKPEVTCVVNACDSDREAEVIFWEVYTALNVNKPVKRLWVSSHTPEDLKKGFKMMKIEGKDEPLLQAGYARQRMDWLFGINLTVAMTKLFSVDEILKVGRVILPTVGLIYHRDMEIKHFKPRKYFELVGMFEGDGGRYEGTYWVGEQTQFEDEKGFIPVMRVVEGKPGMITSYTSKRVPKGPPKLFNLTDLQGFIANKFGFTAEKVLKLVQGLYEQQLVTYPRTASRYLDNSQVEAARRSLEVARGRFPGLEIVFKESKNVFDSTRVDSHPALMPTYMVPGNLNPDEKIVYDEIVKRFCAQFMTPVEFDQVEAITVVEGYPFRTRGRILVKTGWREIYGGFEEEDEPEIKMVLRDGLRVKNLEVKSVGKETKSMAHYTVQTLLEAMQNCGKSVTDDAELLKGYQIGTSATRAETLKKIEKIGYVILKGKSYFITEMGIRLVELFPLKEMLVPDFTGKLEKLLKDMERGEYGQGEFLALVTSMMVSGIEQMKSLPGNISRNDSLGRCPACGSDVVEIRKGFKCVGLGCKFFVFKDNALMKRYEISGVPASLMKLLLGNSLQGDFMLGNKVVRVSLVQAGERWGLNFNFELATDVIIGKCPDCGRDVVEGMKSFRCVGYKDSSCRFVIWKEDLYLKQFGVVISAKMAMGFLNNKVCKVKGMADPKDKAKFDGEIQFVRNPQGLYGFKIMRKPAKKVG